MSPSIDIGEIGEDEYLYRRIPVFEGWYDPGTGLLNAMAFRPRKHDPTGLSLERARSEKNPTFLTLRCASQGPSRYGYYVAVLRAGKLRENGIAILAAPTPESDGHIELPELNYADRKTDNVLELMQILADELTLHVEGPFFSSSK